MQRQGIEEPDHHAYTFIDDPNAVRYDARVKAGKASINGVSIADRKKKS